jgi:N-acetylglucosamine-6-phosphate deacetylase
MVAPGLIDLHVHGAGGGSFTSTDSALQTLRFLARHGVTSVCASLASDSIESLSERVAALETLRSAVPDDAASLIGVHLEGPFISAAQCGAHDPAKLISPTPSSVDRLIELSRAITMITLAPELPGALDAVERFASEAVIVAAGHSEATGSELRLAIKAGLSHITHLWSGQSSTYRRGPWRLPGLLEESLVASLTAEIIADGKHLPPALIEIARRCVGDKLIVVSDGTAGMGMPAGFRYQLSTVQCVVEDGVGKVVGGQAFGGSTTSLPQMLRHLTRTLGWSLADALAGMTSRPAKLAGLATTTGSIKPGLRADLVILDADLGIWGTILRGKWLPGPSGTTSSESR